MDSTATEPAPGPDTSATQIVNDFSVMAATVNGTGSQSANNIFAKTLFRMGIPVGAKNMFPSNIAGLPTWFCVRLSKDGYTARKREVDIMVAMNEETWSKDVKEVRPGGVLIANSDLYSTKNGPGREDITYYPVPFTKLAREKIEAPKLRKLLTNMIYVGVLAEMLGLDQEILEGVVKDQFKGKEKAVGVNLQAVEVGREYFKANFKKTDPFLTKKMDKTQGLMMIEGNAACALGALMGGATVCAWYPITPSSSLCESFIAYAREFRKDKDGKSLFADMQAEDELASAGMVLGAGWTGARAFTATAGPGISLMSEFVGLGYYAEIPGVFFNVQRVGPATGLPTRTSQQDIISTYFLSHGDSKHICLIPGGIKEAYEFSQQAFDLADRFQTPIFVMTDLDLGMNIWMTEMLPYPTGEFDRGKVLDAEALEKVSEFGRYLDVDGDGIPYRTLPGTKHPKAPYFTRGSGHDEYAKYSESNEVYKRNMDRLDKKIETARAHVPKPVIREKKNATFGVIAYGTSELATDEALDYLKDENGMEPSLCRIRALPFAQDVLDFVRKYDHTYVIDLNRDAQMRALLTLELGPDSSRLRSVLHYDGLPVDARTIQEQIVSQEKGS